MRPKEEKRLNTSGLDIICDELVRKFATESFTYEKYKIIFLTLSVIDEEMMNFLGKTHIKHWSVCLPFKNSAWKNIPKEKQKKKGDEMHC